MIAGEFRIIDRLLEVPYEGDPGVAAEANVNEIAAGLESQVPADWQEQGAATLIPSLKIVSGLALLPALRQIAKGEVQNADTVAAVNSNLLEVGDTLLSARALNDNVLRTRRSVKGAVSEFAVLHALWWMKSKGHFPASYCTLPTLAGEDRADYQHGYVMGADLILSDTENEGNDRWIQVKSSDKGFLPTESEFYQKKNTKFHPATVCLSVSHMNMDPYDRAEPLKLIQTIASEDQDLLGEMASRTLQRFDEAKARDIADQAI